jgi:3-deoxy-manno-octulosonate cytidylyltransferase (CMP-KDO synthetase)
MGSTRLASKVLADLGGLPVVERVRRAAVKADCGAVVVATDDRAVLEAVELHGGTAVLTSRRCPSGTDRVAEAARMIEKAQGHRFRVVVNLQGDEPFILPSTIRKTAELAARGGFDIATAVVPTTPREAREPSLVKAVRAADGRCLYFSRSPVPHGEGAGPLQHIGLYAFRRDALARFVRLKPSRLEKAERLEQLRALENGMTIGAVKVSDKTIAIDTAADLRSARRRISKKRRGHG